jgi:hypothetical protein
MAFALVWRWVAPGYSGLQIFFVRPLTTADLRFAIETDGIAVYHSRSERPLVHRDFLSFGGIGLTLALWLLMPGFSWKRRLLWGSIGVVLLFFFHVLVLWGLIAFAQAVESGQTGGVHTLLYSFIAVSDWIVPVLVWGTVMTYYRLTGSGATP